MSFDGCKGRFLDGDTSVGNVAARLSESRMLELTELRDEGFDEMIQTLNADDYINTVSIDYKAGYSSFNTKFAFLGTPGSTSIRELYYGGQIE